MLVCLSCLSCSSCLIGLVCLACLVCFCSVETIDPTDPTDSIGRFFDSLDCLLHLSRFVYELYLCLWHCGIGFAGFDFDFDLFEGIGRTEGLGCDWPKGVERMEGVSVRLFGLSWVVVYLYLNLFVGLLLPFVLCLLASPV